MYKIKYRKYKKLYIGGSSIKNKLLETDRKFNNHLVRYKIYKLLNYGDEDEDEDDDEDDEDEDDEDEDEDEESISSFFKSCRIVACFYAVYFLSSPSNIKNSFKKLIDTPFIKGNFSINNEFNYLNYPQYPLTDGVSVIGIFFRNPLARHLLTPLHYIFINKYNKLIFTRQAWGSGNTQLSVRIMSKDVFDIDNLSKLTKEGEDYYTLIKNLFGVDNYNIAQNGPFYIYYLNESMLKDIMS